MSVQIIAELASCHDGDLGKFLDLIGVAAAAGCTHAKAQFWSSVDRMVERRHAEAYRAHYRRYQMPESWLEMLAEECHRKVLTAACSVYLPEDVPIVAPYVQVLKVASFESEDRALLDAVRATGKRMLLSCGMGGPVDEAHHGPGCDFLACVSAYPAPLDGALSVFVGDSDRYYEGYSDHTKNVWTGAVAVACGAQILEVHIKLDDTDPANPDVAYALSPAELRAYVEGVRTAERLIADVPVDESEMRKFKVRP